MSQHPTESLINYIVSQDPRRARRILYNAGYEVAQNEQQLKSQLFNYIQNDRGDALKNIMKEHPDADYFKSVNVLPDKPPFDKSFPLPFNPSNWSCAYKAKSLIVQWIPPAGFIQGGSIYSSSRD